MVPNLNSQNEHRKSCIFNVLIVCRRFKAEEIAHAEGAFRQGTRSTPLDQQQFLVFGLQHFHVWEAIEANNHLRPAFAA